MPFVAGKVNLNDLPDLSIEKLLFSFSYTMDQKQVANFCLYPIEKRHSNLLGRGVSDTPPYQLTSGENSTLKLHKLLLKLSRMFILTSVPFGWSCISLIVSLVLTFCFYLWVYICAWGGRKRVSEHLELSDRRLWVMQCGAKNKLGSFGGAVCALNHEAIFTVFIH